MTKREAMKRIKYQVAKGVEFMNKEYGRSWLRKIDPERLALDSGTACILGQVEGEYSDALALLGIEDGEKYGFELDSEVEEAAEESLYTDKKLDVGWDDLTEEWRKQVARLCKLFKVEPAHHSESGDRY